MKLDTIIAVKSIEESVKWYKNIFGFRNKHEGKHFAILVSNENEIMLCLHPWERDGHPTMTKNALTPGNGLILYFRTNNLEEIYENAVKMNCKIEEEIHQNPNSLKREFSLYDLDGYYLTVSEFHLYEG